MAQTTVILKAGQKPTKEQIKKAKAEIKEAEKYPIDYSDAPASTPEALEEFAAMARELRKSRRRQSPTVTLRITPDILEQYKSLGKGYTAIMADVLSYAAKNPEILSKARP
jgi:uncharacterized protein (DUF4415 family)